MQLAMVNESRGVAPFYGITHVQAHAQLRASVAVEAQAARYVQFRLGLSVMHMTEHFITGAPACARSGVTLCEAGDANPLYRAVIDLPGQRFAVLGNVSYDLFASALGQF